MDDWNGIAAAVTIIVAICGVIAAVWKGVEAWRKLSRTDEKAAAESAQNSAIKDLAARVERCEQRLEKGDKEFSNSHEDMTQMLTVLNALLMHFISGNDHAKLRQVKEELDNYLSKR